MKRAIFLCLVFFATFEVIYSKERLPAVINQHQPSIFPIISPDGSELYFTRKWHPDNTGGIYDDDDIWVSRKNGSQWGSPENLGEQINKKQSNSLLYIFPDGKKALVYGPYQTTNENQIARATENNPCFAMTKKIGNKWSKPEPLKIEDFYTSSKNYSATMSTDGRVLIMSLQREDSKGNLDLYISFYNQETKTYSKPQNLGNRINTNGVELVSFLAYDNRTLYFASNGRKTKGKLDLFLTRRLDDTWMNWSEPEPLDFLNSEWDENSLSLNITGDTAYFTSGDTLEKREGIYLAELPVEFRPLPYLIIEGKILAKSNNVNELVRQPVYFKIDNFDTDFIFYDTVENGFYRFVVPNKTQYNFFIFAKGFYDYSFSTTSSKFEEPTIQTYDIVLQPQKEKDKLVGTILFQTDVDTLDRTAQEILKQICKNLKDENFSKLLFVGHTDEIGTDEYNLQLSLRRAKNTARFVANLLKIGEDKIEIEGKGKTMPISKDLAKNRRVEIFIIYNE
ncbi:MAG: Outer membrane lipoprotein omp16 precursor [Candidatus Kapaibacterium sp.]|nr:MAG: Outer membrane lipoprotein omp16 precursor [Candidatus Kapabacteria bacterium]